MDSQKNSLLLIIYTTFKYNIVQAYIVVMRSYYSIEIENCKRLVVNFCPILMRKKNKIG